MNKIIIIIFVITLVCFLVTGCSNDYEEYISNNYETYCLKNYEVYRPYDNYEMITIIDNALKDNYPMFDYEIEFLNKENLEVYLPSLDGYSRSCVDGVYTYTFVVKSNDRKYKVFFNEPYKNMEEDIIVDYELDLSELIRGENPYVIKNKIDNYKSITYSFKKYGEHQDTQIGIIYGENMTELKEFLLFLEDNKDILSWNFVITNDNVIYNQVINNKVRYDKYITHDTGYDNIQGLAFSIFENNPSDSHIISYSNDNHFSNCEIFTCTVVFQ